VRARCDVILLNGTSSSGKSSVAAGLQRQLEGVWLHVSFDRWIVDGLPPGMDFETATRRGVPLLTAFNAALRGLLDCDLKVILELVICNPVTLRMHLKPLTDKRVLMVGVRCPLEEAERRERARGDRMRGLARSQFETIHAHCDYDVEVDTSRLSVDEAARVIIDHAAGKISRGKGGRGAPPAS